MLADRVALLDGGVIAAAGTHHELLATQARYRELMSGTAEPGRGEDLDPDRRRGPDGGRQDPTPTARTRRPGRAQAWRGIAAEDVDEITASLASLLRRRGRRLLQDLLAPAPAPG